MFLTTIHTNKTCGRIGINLAHIAQGVHDHTLIRKLLQITTYSFQSQLMQMCRAKYITSTAIDSKSDVWMSITSTAIDSKSDVWMSMTRQMQKHTPYAAVAKSSTCQLSLDILDQWFEL